MGSPGSDAGTDAPIDGPTVTPIPPQTMNSSLRLEVGSAASGTLLASDPNGDALTYSIVTQPTRGTLSAFDPATGAFTYQSTNLAAGIDSITFQVSDGTLSAPTAGTVAIAIDPILFTGYWALTNVTDNGAACSNATFRLGHATPQGGPGFFAWAQRPGRDVDDLREARAHLVGRYRRAVALHLGSGVPSSSSPLTAPH